MNITRNKVIALVATFLFAFLAAGVLPSRASAATWYRPDLEGFAEKVNEGDENQIFGERYTVAQVYWIIGALMDAPLGDLSRCVTAISATQFDTCFESVTGDSGTGTQYARGGSFVSELAMMNDAMIKTKPASGINYIAQKIDKISPVDTAYAQEGFGFTTLGPIQSLWLSMRNLAFGLLTFVIIILAFMIMLRQKISPQAVITIQSALPKIAIALIVITFSYAIAGLLVDLAYVVMGIISAAFVTTGTTNITDVTTFLNVLNNPVGGFTGFLSIMLQSLILSGAIAAIGSFSGVGAIVGGVSLILGLICVILYVIALFRIFIVLLKAYAASVFLIIGFPLIALAGILSVGPGVGGWIRQFASQLTVFVAVCVTIAMAHLVFWYMGGQQIIQTLGGAGANSANPYDFRVGGYFQDGGTDSPILFPGFGGFPVSAIAIFIGFGVLFSAPKIAKAASDQVASGRGSYGLDTWGTMAGPVAGLTAAAWSESRKGAIGLGTTAIQNSRPAAQIRRSASRTANSVSRLFSGNGGGSTTQPSQNANQSIQGNRDSGNAPYEDLP